MDVSMSMVYDIQSYIWFMTCNLIIWSHSSCFLGGVLDNL